LIESQLHLGFLFFNDKLVQMLKGQKCSYDKIGLRFGKLAASSSNIASTSKTVFVKPEMSEPHIECLDKGKNVIVHENAKIECDLPVKKHSESRFIPTCHYYGIVGHIRLNCCQLKFQRPWNRNDAPKKEKAVKGCFT
jgi:hypothetical protein